MYHRVLKVLGFLTVGILTVAAADSVAAADWPILPSSGFITGRPAQIDDVQKGNAVFVAAIKGQVIGKPIPVEIPQYAVLKDGMKPVILVQAEEANNIKMYGIRDFDGKESVVTEKDIQLLGIKKPQ